MSIDYKAILDVGNSLSNEELGVLITQQSHRLWVFVQEEGGDRVLDARMNGACIQINVGVNTV